MKNLYEKPFLFWLPVLSFSYPRITRGQMISPPPPKKGRRLKHTPSHCSHMYKSRNPTSTNMQHTEALRRTDSHTYPHHTHTQTPRDEGVGWSVTSSSFQSVLSGTLSSWSGITWKSSSALGTARRRSIGVENDGMCVAGHSIKLGTSEPHELLIAWAEEHTIFHFKFRREHATVGVMLSQ